MSYILGAPSSDPSDRRPHQSGRAEGFDARAQPVIEPKEWLVDTGAQISVITKSNADKFDLKLTGGSASATTGGGGILVKSGLTMVCEILGKTGRPKAVRCNLDVGVKPNNSGSEILGMDQLNAVHAAVDWNPRLRSGKLYER